MKSDKWPSWLPKHIQDKAHKRVFSKLNENYFKHKDESQKTVPDYLSRLLTYEEMRTVYKTLSRFEEDLQFNYLLRAANECFLIQNLSAINLDDYIKDLKKIEKCSEEISKIISKFYKNGLINRNSSRPGNLQLFYLWKLIQASEIKSMVDLQNAHGSPWLLNNEENVPKLLKALGKTAKELRVEPLVHCWEEFMEVKIPKKKISNSYRNRILLVRVLADYNKENFGSYLHDMIATTVSVCLDECIDKDRVRKIIKGGS